MIQRLMRVLGTGTLLLGTVGATVLPSHADPRAAAIPRCQPGELYIALVPHDGQGATGHLDVVFSVTSVAQASCYLYGYPGIQLINAGGQDIGTHLTWGGGFFFANRPKRYVVLATGKTAYFALGWTHLPTPGQSCPTTKYLLVTPPDGYTPVVVPATLQQVCGGAISASPITTSSAP
ncbi:MAG TPA: DUF4232 domain-containing protein [Chloroflexota bacterium]